MDSDLLKARLRCSLRWLAGMNGAGRPLPSQLSSLPVGKLLLDPYTETGCIKDDVVLLLSDPALYFATYVRLFPEEATLIGPTFWPLIQALARHGVYVLEEDDIAVDHAALAQTTPFRHASHIALIEGMMSLFASTTLNIETVVKAVRKISSFNPSQELPCSVEDALLLWLNKTSQAVCLRHKETHPQPARQQGKHAIPVLDELSSSIAEGQHLAVLLLYYAPHTAKWEDFIFGQSPLSKEQSLQNLVRVRRWCSSNLPTPSFHLQPGEDLLQWAHTGILTPNIQALLAHLFLCLEVRDLGKKASRGGRGSGEEPLSRSLLTKHKPSSMNKEALHSYSTSELLDAPQNSDSKSRNLAPQLSSHSMSYLAGTHSPATGTVFRPPIRTFITTRQAAALANFNNPPQRINPLITASSDRLGIREQMLSQQLTRSSASQQRAPVENISSDESSTEGALAVASNASSDASAGVADVSGNCTESPQTGGPSLACHIPKSQRDMSTPDKDFPAETDSTKPLPSHFSTDTPKPKPSKAIRFCTNMSGNCGGRELRGSFTLHTQHTAASASQAGLPVIENNKEHAVPAVREGRNGVQKEQMSSSSSDSIPSSYRLLQLYPTQPPVELPAPSPAVLEARRVMAVKLEMKAKVEREEMVRQDAFFQKARLELVRQGLLPPPIMEEASAMVEESATASSSHGLCENPERNLEPPQQQQSTCFQKIQAAENSGIQPAHQCSTSRKSPPPTIPSIPLSPIIPVSSSQLQPEEPAALLPTSNPWREVVQNDGATTMELQKEQRKGREQQVMARLEEREKARKANLEARRREYAAKKGQQEQAATNPHTPEPKNTTTNLAIVRGRQAGLEETSSVPPHEETTIVATALSQQPGLEEATAAHLLTHNGPECYVQPASKSNKKLIKNALCYVCLAGDVNISLKQRALSELEASPAKHVLILFRDTIGFKFRALYMYNTYDDQVTRIFGSGPKNIRSSMITHLYKYNSGLKEFKEVHAHYFSLSVDALTIANHYWSTKKSKPPSGACR